MVCHNIFKYAKEEYKKDLLDILIKKLLPNIFIYLQSDVEEILVDLSSSDLIDDLVKNYPNPSKWNKYLKEKAEGFQAIPTEILLAVFNSRITDSYTNIVSSYMKNELDKSNDIKK